MRWRIRSQLLIPLLTLLLGVVGIISAWTAVASANRARRDIETRMHGSARTVTHASFPLNRQTLLLMRELSQAEYLLDEGDGNITATLKDVRALPAGLPEPTDDPETLQLGPRVLVNGKAYLCNGLRLSQRSDGGSVLYILYPESLWRDALRDAIRPSLILGGLASLASLILLLFVGRRLSRRIGELERRTRQIADGDFSPMPLPRGDDEIRDLARSINEMAERLAQLQDTVQKTERLRLLGQVSGGLAHQLRNGVAGARLAVQLHARECQRASELNPETHGDAEALDVALRQLALLESNLKRFLDLGRTGQERRETCSLTTLVDEAVTLLRPRCRHAHIELAWQPPEADATLSGDAGQLGHLFLNVIGNAVEAAGPGGLVRVELQIADCRLPIDPKSAIGNRQSAIVEIWDSGPGPPPEICERLFEPFVTGKREGVGLGLAVTRQVTEGHGGRITWKREAEQTCFVIELPVIEAACGLGRATAKPQPAGKG
jgi:signal transduction histidine kinase